MDTWQSYVPTGRLFRRAAPDSNPLTPTDQSTAKAPTVPPLTTTDLVVHSLQDERWKETQQATRQLEKRSSGALNPNLATHEVNEEQQHAIAAAPGVVHPLEEAHRRDKDLELFALTMERRPMRPTNQLVLQAPPSMQVLSLCAQYKRTSMPWFQGAHATLAANPGLDFPKVPVYERTYLASFMREPDPKASYERPCLNLDRDPYPGEEGRLRCIAHQLSERKFGLRGAYRLRELLHSATVVQINASLARVSSHRGQLSISDPRVHLSEVPEVCVMCHVWMVFDEFLNQKNRREERLLMQRQKAKGPEDSVDLPSVPNDIVMVLNKFMVNFDVPGEYSRDALLGGDEVGLGVYGPFPLWQERNYMPWVDPAGTGLRGFQEVDDMLFQQAPAPSRANESTQVTQVDAFTQSNRTSATAVVTKSRQ